MSLGLKDSESEEVRLKVTEVEENSKEKGAEGTLPNEGNVDGTAVSNVERNEGNSGSLVNEDQQVRRCTRTGVLIKLENTRKKARKAGMAVKSGICRLDSLLREQCTDIVRLSASKGGVTMDMDDFKRFHEWGDRNGVEDQVFR
jgi:hypothetical protein